MNLNAPGAGPHTNLFDCKRRPNRMTIPVSRLRCGHVLAPRDSGSLLNISVVSAGHDEPCIQGKDD
jgi:hypothetical protein